ncbi:MAG: NUDIX hydrolase [Bacteroidota bacterium]
MKYCCECGSDALTFAIPCGDNRERFICSDCDVVHYHNPRIIVGVLAVFEGKVLLCRRAIEPRLGLWNLPAGFLENGESAEKGAARETYEEALAEVNIERLHCVFSIPSGNQVYLHFFATMPTGEFGVTSESTEVKLFAEHEIPWNEIAFSSTAFALKKYFEHPSHTGTHIGSAANWY